MSARYLAAFPSYVIEHKLYYTHQVILYWLCHRAEEDGMVTQPVKDMSELTGLSTPAIYQVMLKLEEKGGLKILEQGLGKGTRRYQLLIPVSEREPEEAPAPESAELPEVAVESVVKKSESRGRAVYEIHVHFHE